MEILDIILFLPLVYGFYSGYSKGIIKQLTEFVAIICAIFFSFMLTDYVKIYLESHELINPKWSYIFGLFFTIISIYIVVKLIGLVFRKVIKFIGLGLIEKLAGGVIGFIKYIIVVYVLVYFVLKINNIMHFIPLNTVEKSVVLSLYNEIFSFFDAIYS